MQDTQCVGSQVADALTQFQELRLPFQELGLFFSSTSSLRRSDNSMSRTKHKEFVGACMLRFLLKQSLSII